MILLPPIQRYALRANSIAHRAAQPADRPEPDSAPIVKFFNPVGAATWLATEFDADGDTPFGLCEALHNPKYVEYAVMLRAGFPAPLSAAPGRKSFA